MTLTSLAHKCALTFSTVVPISRQLTHGTAFLANVTFNSAALTRITHHCLFLVLLFSRLLGWRCVSSRTGRSSPSQSSRSWTEHRQLQTQTAAQAQTVCRLLVMAIDTAATSASTGWVEACMDGWRAAKDDATVFNKLLNCCLRWDSSFLITSINQSISLIATLRPGSRIANDMQFK